MSNININAYNKLSAAFDYAQRLKNDPTARGGDSVVHLQDGNTLTCNYSQADAPKSLFHHAERSQDKKELNNATRDLFKQAVIDIFGTSINDVPKSVRSAMELGKFDGVGRPLTARRILAVNKAIDAELKAVAKSLGITGGSAAEILAAVASRNSDILESANPAATFKARAKQNATACVATSIASEASKAAKGQGSNTFQADLERGMAITVGGKRVQSRDADVARDKVVQMLTGDKRATFHTVDMSGHANFHTIGGFTALHLPPSPQVEDDIHAAGNVTIKGEVKYTQCFMVNTPKTGMAPKFAGHDGSYAKFEGVIKISAQNLDDLAKADWEQCDVTESNQMEWHAANENRFARAADLIPPNFRFTGDVEVSMKVNINDERTRELPHDRRLHGAASAAQPAGGGRHPCRRQPAGRRRERRRNRRRAAGRPGRAPRGGFRRRRSRPSPMTTTPRWSEA